MSAAHPPSRHGLIAIAFEALGPAADSVRLEMGGVLHAPAEVIADFVLADCQRDDLDFDIIERCRWYALDLADDLPKHFPAWRGYGVERSS